MDPPLEARYKKRARRGNERRMVEYQVTLVAERPATTSHIRNNSPDYFPTGLQFANLLEKLVKYRRTAALYVCVCVCTYVRARCTIPSPPAILQSTRVFAYIFPSAPLPPLPRVLFPPRFEPIGVTHDGPFVPSRPNESMIL